MTTQPPFAFYDNRFATHNSPQGQLVWPQVGRYHNGSIAIRLLFSDADTGFVEPWATATVALDFKPNENCVFIKAWSENENIEPLLVDANIIQPVPEYEHYVNFVTVYEYRLTDDFVAFINQQGEEA